MTQASLAMVVISGLVSVSGWMCSAASSSCLSRFRETLFQGSRNDDGEFGDHGNTDSS